MNDKCLYCYQPLSAAEQDFHFACSKKMFGVSVPPLLSFSEGDFESLALEVIKSQTTITGVQPKISLHLNSSDKDQSLKKFTIVGLWGGFILKPPTPNYPELPEVEDLTMHLATLAKIDVAPHSLIRLQSGKLAYITKRIDRIKKQKWHMEDMCQLTERLTENKYRGSYEQIAKTIKKYSVNPGLDLINFFEMVVFSFITGNADMHLKNFSLLHSPEVGVILSPAYDLVATALVNPLDDEDLALTLNGRKKKLRKADFVAAFNTLNLEEKQQEYIFKKMIMAKPAWIEMIKISFLSEAFKIAYIELIETRLERLK